MAISIIAVIAASLPPSLCAPKDWRWPITIIACWLVIIIAYEVAVYLERPRSVRAPHPKHHPKHNS